MDTRRRMRRAAVPALAGLLCAAALLLAPAAGVRARAEEEATVPPAPEGFRLDGDVERGRAQFVKTCATCHGEDGSGQGRIKTDPPARDLRDAERMQAWSDWRIYLVIRDGGEALGLSSKMIPWGSLFDDQKIRDLAAFVKSLSQKDADAPPPPD